jgi:hypothetical protein
MNIEHFILATNSSIDSERNSLSIFDVIEDIDIHTSVSNIIIPIQAILVLKRSQNEEGEFQFKGNLEIIGPSDEKLVDQPLIGKMEPIHRRLRLKINIGLPVVKSGFYKFKVSGEEGSNLLAERDARITLHFEKKK